MEPMKYTVTKEDILLDLLLLTDGLFDGEVVRVSDALEVRFAGGQVFLLSVSER